jgi:hypothetical protein
MTPALQARSQGGGRGALPPQLDLGQLRKEGRKKFYVVDPDACPSGVKFAPQQQIPGYGPAALAQRTVNGTEIMCGVRWQHHIRGWGRCCHVVFNGNTAQRSSQPTFGTGRTCLNLD